MANFQDSRFLGLSPRALGLGVVAVGIVVGLFFIPETVKLLFDAKPRGAKDKVVASKQQPAKRDRTGEEGKAALAPDVLSTLNTKMQRNEGEKSQVERTGQGAGKAARGKGGDSDDGLFSGWNFQVKADHGGGQSVEIPAALSFEKLGTKEGITFFKKGRGAIGQFVRSQRAPGVETGEAISPFIAEVDFVASGGAKSISAEEMTNRLRHAHARTLKALRAAGMERNDIMKWLQVPVVRFVDQRGQVFAERMIRAQFKPSIVLTDLAVQGVINQAWSQSGTARASFRAQFDVTGSDVERVAIYSNGRLLREIRPQASRDGGPKSIKMNGEADGVVTVVAYDRFGARPFWKSYGFYPKVRVFRQSDNGVYQIGFLPGSARNSLDRFFYVGGASRPSASDPMIAQF